MFLGRSYKLIDKGLIISSTRGEIEFALPRFKEFVQFENLLRKNSFCHETNKSIIVRDSLQP